MFSYLSTKFNTQNIFQNNLIQEIQCIATEIFDHQTTSITKTDLQQMSLQLSPATSQDNLQIKRRDDHSHHDNQNQEDLVYYSQSRPRIRKSSQQWSDLKKQKIETKKSSNIQKKIKQGQAQKLVSRMTKSMIVNNASIKEPGSFSNKYLMNSNVSVMNTQEKPTIMKRKKLSFEQEQQQSAQQNQQILKKSNLNKVNIFQGILNENSNKKSQHKTNQRHYGSNYLSPYSKKSIKQNPKSYMEKLHPMSSKPKQTLQLQYIKKRINENIQPHISYRKEKSQRNKLCNPKLSNVKSKYKESKPILYQYKSYIDQHIYKKTKDQMKVWEQKKKIYQSIPSQQIQYKWQQFIEKQQKFLQQKKNSILKLQLENMQKQAFQHLISPAKNIGSNDQRISKSNVTPSKLTPQDYVKKYKRQKQKLKQKLQTNEISNFMERSYENCKRFGKQILQSVWGSSLSKHPENVSIIQGFSTIKQASQFGTSQNKRQVPIPDESANKKERVNIESQNSIQSFFMSLVSEKAQRKSKHQNKIYDSNRNQNRVLVNSTLYQQKNSSNRKSISDAKKNQNIRSNSENKSQEKSASLSPFLKKSPFQCIQRLRQKTQNKKPFDPRKHSSPLFNQYIISSSHAKSYTQKKSPFSKNSISQLLNPKYFRSINQLQEYSSNSRQKINYLQKTFQQGQKIPKQREYISIHNGINNQQGFRKASHYESRKNVISKFDHNLMKKTIQDIEKMRKQIQENKKKRKYCIDNYRNFSNVRENYLFEKNHSKNKSKDPILVQISPRNRSRSVSPIFQQDSISNHTNLSISAINLVEDSKISNQLNNSQMESRTISKSNIIMVTNKKQIQFLI